jgi:roadblock/LC7 domain-containing protein
MPTLDELIAIDGVRVAFEFNADGELTDYRTGAGMQRELAAAIAHYCATVTMNFQTLSGSFTLRSQMNWVPQKAWLYTSRDWTVVVGDGGYRGLFVETNKADFNQLIRLLVGGIGFGNDTVGELPAS